MMKHLLLTTIAAVLLVGCGNPEADRALRVAIREGNIEAAKQAIDDGADVNAKDKRGQTPLLNAAPPMGHKEIIELLIAKGADVNAKTESGWNPLHRAAYYRHKEIVELLIAKGADVNAKDDTGDTPLDSAASKKQICDLLRKHGGKTSAELKAAGN